MFDHARKTLERLARHRWYDKKQYPDIYFEILSTISWLRTWAKDYKVFSNNQVFQESMGNFTTGIADQVSILIETSHYSPGKKKGRENASTKTASTYPTFHKGNA